MARRRTTTNTFAGHVEGLKASYQAAKTGRFRPSLSGVSYQGTGADYHLTDNDLLRLIETARYHDRNNMIVGQGVTRLVDNVIQSGFNLDPQTGDANVDALLKARWAEWAGDPDRCDSAGRYTFRRKEWLTLRQMIVDGDVFHLGLTGGQIQTVEAHRVRTPSNTKQEVALGVKMDSMRRAIEYWIAKEDIDPRSLKKVSDVQPIPVRDRENRRVAFHCYLPERISQTRGITALNRIVDCVGMHDDIQFANLVKQQMAAALAIIRTRPMGASFDSGDQFGARESETVADGTTRTVENFSPGLFIEGAPGESLTAFTANVPNAEFFNHALLILTFIAVNLNIPVAVLLLDPKQTNFSGWRGAIDQARISFSRIQSALIEQFHAPVYTWKLWQWIATDDEVGAAFASLGPAFFLHRWNPPAWDYIEPAKDATADATKLDRHLSSPRRVYARRGMDWDDVAREIVEDRGALIELALQRAAAINATWPDAKLDWREILAPIKVPTAAPPAEADAEETQARQEEARAQDAA